MFDVADERVVQEFGAEIIVRGLCEERAKMAEAAAGTDSTFFPRNFFRLAENGGKSREFRCLSRKIGTEGKR